MQAYIQCVHSICLATFKTSLRSFSFPGSVTIFISTVTVPHIRKLQNFTIKLYDFFHESDTNFPSATFTKTKTKQQLMSHFKSAGKPLPRAPWPVKTYSLTYLLWYIYNCTMSSSYIVRALFLLIKLNISNPAPSTTPTPKNTPPLSLTSVTVTVNRRRMKQQEKQGEVEGCVCMVRGLWDYLHHWEMVKYHVLKSNKVLTEIQYPEWRNDTAFLCYSQQLKSLHFLFMNQRLFPS